MSDRTPTAELSADTIDRIAHRVADVLGRLATFVEGES